MHLGADKPLSPCIPRPDTVVVLCKGVQLLSPCTVYTTPQNAPLLVCEGLGFGLCVGAAAHRLAHLCHKPRPQLGHRVPVPSTNACAVRYKDSQNIQAWDSLKVNPILNMHDCSIGCWAHYV